MAKSTDIPRRVRDEVLERDRGCCRVCGRFADPAALHHIIYRSQERNLHVAGNLVVVGYAYGHLCHQMVHARPRIFQPALLHVVDKPWLTAAAHLRQSGVDIRGLMKGSL